MKQLLRRIFDLNAPPPQVFTREVHEVVETRDDVSAVVGRAGGTGEAQEQKAPVTRERGGMSTQRQILLYGCSVVGVLMSTSVLADAAGKSVNPSLSIPVVLIALVIAAMVAPVAFKVVGASRTSPLLFQAGWFVSAGVFWQVVIAGVKDVLSKA